MRRWLYPSAYHGIVLFALMGLSGAVFAWMSLGLLSMGMANYGLLREHGLRAALDGGLWQIGEIALRGTVALLAYLGFKGAEVELIRRWRPDGD